MKSGDQTREYNGEELKTLVSASNGIIIYNAKKNIIITTPFYIT